MYLNSSFEVPLVNVDKFYIGTWIFEDNSICIATSQQDSTKLQHYDSKGLINEFCFNLASYQSGIASISSHEMILLHKKTGHIQYVNVLTKQKRFIDYNFKSTSPFNHHIISFLKSSLFCVHQDFKQNQLKKINLTYFDKNLNKISQYSLDNSDRQLRHIVLNHSSKLALFKIKQTNTIKINLVDSTSTSVFEGAFPTLGDYVIKEMFELSSNKLILYCQSTTPNKLMEWNLEQKTMKPLLINGIKQDEILDIYFGGDYLYFLMKQTEGNNNLFVVDENTLEIVHKNAGFKDFYHKYRIEMNKGRSRLAQFKTDRGNFTTVGVRILEIVNQKELYLSMLEQIEDFDQEMLRSIVCAVQYKKE